MIYNKYIESGVGEKVSIILEYIKKGINIPNIIFIIFSLLVSSQSFMGEYEPFSIVLFGLASVFNIPLLLVLISSLIGMIINGVTTFSLIKIVSLFIVFSLITALINIEGVSKKYSVFFKLISSFFIVEIVANIIGGTFISSILSVLTNSVIIAILFFVLVPGMAVLLNIRKSYIYSKEESIAFVVLLAIGLAAFKNLNIFNFSVYNIMVMVLVLVYGWKNGAILGTTSGLLIGLLLTGLTDANMSLVVSMAVSGGLAGLFSKFGKISIIIAFILGNIYISYYSSGFSELTIRLSEMLIASISLLFMPKSIELKLDKLFNKNNTLNKVYENVLGSANSAKEKIGALSEVFDSLSNIKLESTTEDLEETKEVIKKYIKDYVENNCIECKEKKECLNDKKIEDIAYRIANKLENNEKIDASLIDFKCYIPEDIIINIMEIYNSMKLTRLLKKREEENSIKLSNQYKEVSKILSLKI